ncbi:hypothetical protein BKA91DRAFT_49706 [Yarrowia lipolytica]|nr:hypothetical protein BKA91DRAFT_49706 [Yarrowia lipolytica]KAE8169567.1 hypothetical protein BKA90DRAFT_47202 [Yarrowia lipolytica]RMI94352.1 hypothetical protein BD777DRAFT_25274 [Yarrowia lipolytica]
MLHHCTYLLYVRAYFPVVSCSCSASLLVHHVTSHLGGSLSVPCQFLVNSLSVLVSFLSAPCQFRFTTLLETCCSRPFYWTSDMLKICIYDTNER